MKLAASCAVGSRRRASRRWRRASKIAVYAVLGLWTLVVLFPLYWVLVTSFKIEVQVDSGPFYIPFVDFKPTLDAWNFMLLQNNTLGPYVNSIMVTLSSTVLALVIGALAAYALVRIRFQVKLAAILTFIVLLIALIIAVAALHVPWQAAGAVAIALFLLALGTFVRRFKGAVGNNDIEFWMISNRIMPPIVAVLPIYVMFQHLQLLDTKLALIATYTGVNLPIVVWLTRDFFAGVPSISKRARKSTALPSSGYSSRSPCPSRGRALPRLSCSYLSWPGTSSCSRCFSPTRRRRQCRCLLRRRTRRADRNGGTCRC